jgi:hypothetical protein
MGYENMAMRYKAALTPEQESGGGDAELGASKTVTDLTSCAEFHFNNIVLFITRLVIFAYLTARFLPNN